MRRAIAAAALASLAAAAQADGTTEQFYTMPIKEGRVTSSTPLQPYIGRNDGRIQSFEIKDWSFERVNKIDSFTVKQKVKPVAQGASQPPRANDRLRSAGPKDGWPSAQAGRGIDIARVDGEIVGPSGAGAKPHRPSDITLKRGTSAGAAGGLGKDLQAQDRMGNAPSAAKRPDVTWDVAEYRAGDAGKAPPPSGTLRVKVRFPWLACEEGKFYPQLVMGSPVKATYILGDATVTGCSNEVVTFSYSKVEFERTKPH